MAIVLIAFFMCIFLRFRIRGRVWTDVHSLAQSRIFCERISILSVNSNHLNIRFVIEIFQEGYLFLFARPSAVR